MKNAIKFVNGLMDRISINYQYGEWKGKRKTPYFVGAYQETETRLEDGYTSGTMTIDGWTNEDILELIETSDKIKDNYIDIQEIMDGVLMRARYSGSTSDPVETQGLHHIIITLEIEEWKGA